MENIAALPMINEVNKKNKKKIKIMQFGEGNFLRAFVDWIIESTNKASDFDAGVVVVQPMPFGRVKALTDVDGLYTLFLQGLQDGKAVRKSEVIHCIDDGLDPFTEYDKFMQYAVSDDLQFIVSNTTEAGIVFNPEDTDTSKCPISYPGKLLALLKARYEAGKKGLFIIPCELIDHNGATLKEVLIQLAKHLGYSEDLINWIEEENKFYNTLVDRIVPGYPKAEAAQFQMDLGYQDNNMVVGEIFHLWCIDAQAAKCPNCCKANLEALKAAFPAEKAGLNVLFVDSIVPYKQRKVKILNGSHTTLCSVSYLAGINTVRETIEDADLGKFVKEFIFDEVIPTIDLPHDQMVSFANSVLDRYMNPYVRHELMSIALNTVSKFKERVYPTIVQNLDAGRMPKHALFSLAALMTFYKGYRPIVGSKIHLADNPEFLNAFNALWEAYDGTEEACFKIAQTVLAWEHWGVDLNKYEGVTEYVSECLYAQQIMPMRNAIKFLVK